MVVTEFQGWEEEDDENSDENRIVGHFRFQNYVFHWRSEGLLFDYLRFIDPPPPS